LHSERIYIPLNDTSTFIELLKAISKIMEEIEVKISPNYLQMRGFDPFNYFYLDSRFEYSQQEILKRNKKASYKKPLINNSTFVLKIDDISNILPKIGKKGEVKVSYSKETLIFSTISKKLKTEYSIKWEELATPIFPNPKKREYEYIGKLSGKEFYNALNALVQNVNEIKLHTLADNRIKIKGEIAKLKSVIELPIISSNNKEINFKLLYSYLKHINKMIKLCDDLKIHLGEGLPAKFQLLKYETFDINFYFSPEREYKLKKEKLKISFPLVKMPNFIDFLYHINEQDEQKEYVHVLTSLGLETKGGDNSRLGKMLGYTKKVRGVVYLTEDGKSFINNYIADPEETKQNITAILMNEYPELELLINNLDLTKPTNAVAVYVMFKDEMRKNFPEKQIKEIDFNTITHIFSWCGLIKFEKGQIVRDE